MSSQEPVYESKATYYKTSEKKWLSGTFTLNGNCILFNGDEDNIELSLRLRLNTISGLEKRQSSFIYAAVVISVGSEKHWFASFPNRDSVYNLLEMFWRESLLLVTNRQTSPKPKEASSALGRDLLSILHESEVCLVDAANALSCQGRQLEESQMVMQDINSDLSTAEMVLRSMSFPPAVIKINESKSKSEVQEPLEEKSRQKHYKVTFSERSSAIIDYGKGTLIIADNIFVLDEHQNRRFAISNNEVEKILITSPWAFSLDYSSEWVTKTCYFICPQLSGLLKFLNSVPSLKSKVAFENENSPCGTATCSKGTTSGETSNLEPAIVCLKPTESSNSSPEQVLTQDDNVISDEDMEQISNVLNNLQALATEVSREQQDQMEKINFLISDVDKTGLRITENNKNIKKAM